MQTFLKPFTAFTSLAHTGNVAFDIGGGGYNNINEKSGGDTNESFYGQGFSA